MKWLKDEVPDDWARQGSATSAIAIAIVNSIAPNDLQEISAIRSPLSPDDLLVTYGPRAEGFKNDFDDSPVTLRAIVLLLLAKEELRDASIRGGLQRHSSGS